MIYDLQAPLIFMIVSLTLTLLIVSTNDIFVEFRYDVNKKTPYECGFQPFDNNLQQFDIKYYLVALLFLIFDVETLFLIPYISVHNFVNLFVYYNVFFFILILFLGFLYE